VPVKQIELVEVMLDRIEVRHSSKLPLNMLNHLSGGRGAPRGIVLSLPFRLFSI